MFTVNAYYITVAYDNKTISHSIFKLQCNLIHTSALDRDDISLRAKSPGFRFWLPLTVARN